MMVNKLIIAFIILSVLGSAGGYITHIIAENARLEFNITTISNQWSAERKKLAAREKSYNEAEIKYNDEVTALQKSINQAAVSGDKCVNALVPDGLHHYTNSRRVVPSHGSN